MPPASLRAVDLVLNCMFFYPQSGEGAEEKQTQSNTDISRSTPIQLDAVRRATLGYRSSVVPHRTCIAQSDAVRRATFC